MNGIIVLKRSEITNRYMGKYFAADFISAT